MKALIVSGVMLFSASVSAADENRSSITAELKAQIADISEQGMQSMKQSASDSIEKWADEFLSDLHLAETQQEASNKGSQKTQ